MGFGGAAGMITSLKNNNRRLKHEAFDGWTTKGKKSKGIKVEPVSEKVLHDVRIKLKKQRQDLFRKRVIGSFLIITLIIGVLSYIL